MSNNPRCAVPIGFNSNPSQDDSRCLEVTFSPSAAQADNINVTLADVSMYAPIQTMYVDNSANAVEVKFIFPGTNQVVKCPSNSQGYFQVLALPLVLQVSCSASSSITVNVWFTNVIISGVVWGGLT